MHQYQYLYRVSVPIPGLSTLLYCICTVLSTTVYDNVVTFLLISRDSRVEYFTCTHEIRANTSTPTPVANLKTNSKTHSGPPVKKFATPALDAHLYSSGKCPCSSVLTYKHSKDTCSFLFRFVNRNTKKK